MRLVMAVIVWIVAAIAAVEVSSVVAGSIHDRSGSTTDPTAMTATDPASMFRTANLDKALATVRSRFDQNPSVDNFVIYPGYVSLTVIRLGLESDVTVYADGRYVQTDTSTTPSPNEIFPLSRVNTNVPMALVGRIGRAAHMPMSQLHYMVVELDPISHKLQWLVMPVAGSSVQHFEAPGAHGPLIEYGSGSSGPKRLSG